MSLEKNDATDLKILREFVKDHILPRLTQLEEEVRVLREVTWPVCQSIREQTQISDIQKKKQVLLMLDPEEARKLLDTKTKISRQSCRFSSTNLSYEEIWNVFSDSPK